MSSYFKSAWGGIRLWASKVSTEAGRSLAVQTYTRGDVPDAQDRGSGLHHVRLSLLFDDMTGETKPAVERLTDLLAKINEGKAQLLTHPIEGTFLAMIGEFSYEIDEHGTITAEAQFLAVENVGAVVVAPLGASLDDTDAAMSSAADELQQQLADLESSSDLPTKMKDVGSSWTDEAKSARDVMVDVGQLSDQMWLEIDNLELAADVALYPAMRAYVLAGEATRAAGAVASGDTASVMELTVDGPIALRTLLAQVFGADQAEGEYDRALQMNDIPNPGRIDGGTVLRLRQPAAPTRRV